MLGLIREFFDKHVATPETRGGERYSIELPTAALLVETARLDGAIGPAERTAILDAVRAKFGLGAQEADALVALAEAEARTANDYYQFTSLINERFTLAQKERVIELMWQVAYADAALSAHEQHLMRKIGDLLYVPHGNYIAAKMRARDAEKG
jgi:uncharacterized tellurite resistance protein B-like protein